MITQMAQYINQKTINKILIKNPFSNEIKTYFYQLKFNS